MNCRHVWEWFSDLLMTRQTGMADNPITYTEIGAYARLTRTVIQPWEARAIVLVYWAFRQATPKKGPAAGNETAADDGAGVKAMLKGMGAKKAER